MASTDITKRVLAAILHWLPEDGSELLAKLEIRETWGDIVHIRLALRPTTKDLAMGLRSAVEDALDGFRHRVEVEWEPVDH